MNFSTTRLSAFLLATFLVLTGPAAAQGGPGAPGGGDPREEIKKRMDEISNLMRASELLLLEVSNVDRLVQSQKAVDAELQKLLKDPPQQSDTAPAAEARREKQDQLEKKQGDLKEKLQRLLQGQGQSGKALERSLAELLRAWPKGGRGPSSNSPKNDRQKKKKDGGDKSQKKPRDPQDKMLRDKERKKRNEERRKSALERKVDAWLARLPPEEQERLRRGDFSNVPQRYRRLVERYTINAAKREAEEDKSER